MADIVSRIRHTLDRSSKQDNAERPTLGQRRRSSSVPISTPWSGYSSVEASPLKAIPALPSVSTSTPGSQRRRRREEEATEKTMVPEHDECICCAAPTHDELQFMVVPTGAVDDGKSSDQHRGRGRAMSLSLCVDELDLKRGKRARIASSHPSSIASPTDAFLPGPGSAAASGHAADPKREQSGFNKGMPLSFAKHCDPVPPNMGKRRRLGDPM